MAGLTSEGFVKKTLDEILTEIQEAQLADISPGLNQTSAAVLGQLNGIFADRLSELWEVCEDLYRAIDPDGAEGDALDILAALTGVVRLAATKSTVTLTLNLNAATTVPAGSIVSVTGNPTARFVTLADVTSVGSGNYSAAAEAESTGVVVGLSGTITVIETPVSGWNSVTNALDANTGREVETNAALRLRREELLRAQGNGTVDALASDIRNVKDVTSATVYENTTDVTDVDGVPPHAFEAVVLGGTSNAIAQAIWDSKPAGIKAHGSASGTAVDIDGANHSMAFSRPTEVPIYYEIHLTKTAATYVGDTAVKAALVAYGDALGVGGDVITEKSKASVISLSGVTDITAVLMSLAPMTSSSPGSAANIIIGSRQISTWDTSRITVVAV